MQVCRHPHGGHAGIVHRHDSHAHEQAAQRKLEVRRTARADHVEADSRDGHGHDK